MIASFFSLIKLLNNFDGKRLAKYNRKCETSWLLQKLFYYLVERQNVFKPFIAIKKENKKNVSLFWHCPPKKVTCLHGSQPEINNCRKTSPENKTNFSQLSTFFDGANYFSDLEMDFAPWMFKIVSGRGKWQAMLHFYSIWKRKVICLGTENVNKIWTKSTIRSLTQFSP